MDKTLQDLAWSCLPKEFKEEVKKLYREFTFTREGYYKELFGRHNLTSDAEGEEILTVSRKKVQEIYRDADNLRKDPAIPSHAAYWNAEVELLQDLFGSKCLPDYVATSAPNVDSSEPNVDSSEPKKSRGERCGANTIICAHMNCQDYPPQSEPKYRKGEKVCYNGYVYEIEGLVGKNRYALKGLNFDLDEDMIEPYEPYTEPLSQNPTKNCDNESHISADCNKPAEAKFTKGDMVHCKSFGYEGDYKVLEYTGGPRNCYDCIDKYGAYYRFYESDLEPYTEPTDLGREVNFPTKSNLAIYLK